MIRVTGTLTCKTPEQAAIVRRLVPDHVALSRAEPGCLTFNIHPAASPLVWQLDETFVSRQTFDAHQPRTRASAWLAATTDLARNFTVTEVGARSGPDDRST